MPSILTFLFLANLNFEDFKVDFFNEYPYELINGNIAERKDYPEVIYVYNSEGARCSATVVGPRVILTAAHCIDEVGTITTWHRKEPKIVAVCEISPLYAAGTEDHDMALCQATEEIDLKPASIAGRQPKIGEQVLLTGYGCTGYDGGPVGGNDGKLRTGLSTVISLPSKTDWFYTKHDASLCSGDSGGPAYLIPKSGDVRDGDHEVVGVNSRGNMLDTSLLLDLTIKQSRRFMKDWALLKGLEICGITTECGSPPRPGHPSPEDWHLL